MNLIVKPFFEFLCQIFRQLFFLIDPPHDPWMDLLLFISCGSNIERIPDLIHDATIVRQSCQTVRNVALFNHEHKLHNSPDWINVQMIFWIPFEINFSNVIDPSVFPWLRIFATIQSIFWSTCQAFFELFRIKIVFEFLQVFFDHIQYSPFIHFLVILKQHGHGQSWSLSHVQNFWLDNPFNLLKQCRFLSRRTVRHIQNFELVQNDQVKRLDFLFIPVTNIMLRKCPSSHIRIFCFRCHRLYIAIFSRWRRNNQA